MKLTVFFILFISFINVNAQPLKIGVLINDPPFSMQVGKNNTFTGFEDQLIAEVCKRLQASCSYIPLEFKKFFPYVFEHKIDLAIGQISITEPRAQQFLFSIPYMVADGQFITKKNSPIKEVSELRGKKIGVYQFSLYKDYLLLKYNQDVDIHEYESTPLAFQGLVNEDVDALLLADLEEKYWIANSQYLMDDFHFLGEPIPLGDGYGIMANLDDLELIEQINQILLKMQSDGTYVRLYNLYFGLI